MKEIKYFSATQRFVHWLQTAAFIVLMLTGLFLYLPFFQGFVQGDGGTLSRSLHRVGAVAFVLVPILYLVFDPRGAFDSLKRVFRWGKADLGWVKAAPRYYLLGDEKGMPPQDRFNTGQKLFYLVVVVCMVGFIVTGLLMWFGKGTMSPGLFLWAVFVHDVCTIAYAVFFLVHLMLATMHPLMKGSLNGMLFGWLPQEYVKSHHARYYEEIRLQVSKRDSPDLQTVPVPASTASSAAD